MSPVTVIDVEPIYLDNASLVIAEKDYAAAASKIECKPNVKTSTFSGMKKGASWTNSTVEGYTLDVDFAQDFETATSFSNFLHANQGQTVEVEFAPVTGGQAWLVDVQLVPGGIGGAGRGHATSSISLGVQGEPRKKTGA